MSVRKQVAQQRQQRTETVMLQYALQVVRASLALKDAEALLALRVCADRCQAGCAAQSVGGIVGVPSARKAIRTVARFGELGHCMTRTTSSTTQGATYSAKNVLWHGLQCSGSLAKEHSSQNSVNSSSITGVQAWFGAKLRMDRGEKARVKSKSPGRKHTHPEAASRQFFAKPAYCKVPSSASLK